MPDPAASSYDSISKILHWTIAVAILFMLPLGDLMQEDFFTDETRHLLFTLHKTTGLFILLAASFRLVWHRMNPPPPFPPMPKWQKMTAGIVHAALNLLSVAIPMAGIGILASRGLSIHDLFEETHGAMAGTIAFLIAIHVGAAFLHHFIERDEVFLRIAPICAHAVLNRLRGM